MGYTVRAAMRESGPRYLALFFMTASLLLAAPLDASELPVRSFTTVDGLSDNRVNRIVLDSRGLLWVCTASGISRFDGSHFQNFDDERVMPFGAINDLLESPDGSFWLASNGGGVIRFSLSSRGSGSVAFPVSQEPTSNRVILATRVRNIPTADGRLRRTGTAPARTAARAMAS